MKLICLGTGAPLPSEKRNPSSYALKFPDESIWIFDCGEGCALSLQKQSQINVNNIKAIYITHLHNDHVIGLFSLLLLLHKDTKIKSLDIVGPMGIYELIDTVFRLTHGYVGFHLNIIELPGDEQTVLSPRVAAIAPLEHIQEYSFPVVAFPLSHEIRSFGYILDLPLSLCENPLVHSTMEGKYHRLLICGDNGVGFGREAGSYKPIGDKLSSSSLLQTISCADGACASSSATPSSSMPVSSSSAEVKCSIHNIKRDEEHPHKIRPQISQIVYPECLSSLKIPDSMLCLPPSPAPTAEYGYQPPLFAGDRGDWERIVRMCTPVDTLLHEATHSVTKLKVPERMGHSSSVIAAQRANEIKAKRLIITHFPRTTQFSEGGIEMLAQEARSALNSSAELIVAEDGLTINLF